MIERQGVYEIVYRKDHDERIWHISNIETSEQYGGRCILAYCHELGKDLVFNIEKIVSAERYWIDILDENDTAPRSGAYLFVCRGDMHLVTELYFLNQGERLNKYFEGEYGHCNGWAPVDTLAYHFVGECGKTFGWLYTPDQNDNSSIHVEKLVAVKAKSPLTLHSLIADCGNGIQYCLFDSVEELSNSLAYAHMSIASVTQMGLYTYFPYMEMNHSMHWKLYERRHPKTETQI